MKELQPYQIGSNLDASQIENRVERALQESSYIINKTYLSELHSCEVQPIFSSSQLNYYSDVSLFRLDRLVIDNDQSVQESLVAAYTALGAAGFTLFFYIECDGHETSFYIGARGMPNGLQGSSAGQLLKETFHGHFAGTRLEAKSGEEIETIFDNLSGLTNLNQRQTTITSVSGIPSLAIDSGESFMQGIERFIDAAEGREYKALILSEPLSNQQLKVVQLGYEAIATQLSPFLMQTHTVGATESHAMSIALGESFSEAVGKSLSDANTAGMTTSDTKTSSSTKTEGQSSTESNTRGMAWGASVSLQRSQAATSSSSQTDGYSKSVGKSASRSYTVSDSNTKTQGSTQTDTETHNRGTSESISFEKTNKTIAQLLKKIDQQLLRVEAGEQHGAWNSAAYFIGSNFSASESLASVYLGLMRGKNSSAENFALTTWSSIDKVSRALRWLKNLTHPRLDAHFIQSGKIDFITPATLISGKELAVQMTLPRGSTSGTVVLKTQAFGRQVQYLDCARENNTDSAIELGHIRHLWEDRKQSVSIDLNNLTKHLFITGSTGSGKSNTTYLLLKQLQEKEIPFLVIEPAKGEYKHVFGNDPKTSVYGTNPRFTDLLKINPFSFPKDVHVLEHVDRLIEIFNVCWPMYAAMPAVLKEAILEAYRVSGWDLEDSRWVEKIKNKHKIGPFYPNFYDVKIALERVIQRSAFSQEVKSNYIGSLVTRVNSLTNGLNGQIFTDHELDNHSLFNRNCIIDLSRVGSAETKSLIMGLLLIKLSEYRMSEGGVNRPLQHVTVLEEAHNILKASSSGEQANLQAHSVEMLTNSIAEMRTYGEGFVIVDQSPGAVDIAAIRNTNTKIIMRLPEELDRRSVGKSIGLNDEQIDEISKFPTGVALVSQNDWLEPVLCKISPANVNDNQCYEYVRQEENLHADSVPILLTQMLFERRLSENYRLTPKLIESAIEKAKLSVIGRILIGRVYVEYKADRQQEVSLFDPHNQWAIKRLLQELYSSYKEDSVSYDAFLQKYWKADRVLLDSVWDILNKE